MLKLPEMAAASAVFYTGCLLSGPELRPRSLENALPGRD
jgi:hypothetical protein